jgi:hypothetical protein
MSSTELAAASAPLLPDPAQARAQMERYQEITRACLTGEDWIGRPGEQGSFVKKSGWEKIARAYSISTEIVSLTIDRDEQGNAQRSRAVVRATEDATGRHRDGDGGCATNEPRFQNPKGTQKVEQDIPATAVTRASNRAISNLVGFGQVSADELDGDVRAGAGETFVLPWWAQTISNDELKQAGIADHLADIVEALGADRAVVKELGGAIREECDGVPKCVANTISRIWGTAPADTPAAENGGA